MGVYFLSKVKWGFLSVGVYFLDPTLVLVDNERGESYGFMILWVRVTLSMVPGSQYEPICTLHDRMGHSLLEAFPLPAVLC